jgi:hypothetical protein
MTRPHYVHIAFVNATQELRDYFEESIAGADVIWVGSDMQACTVTTTEPAELVSRLLNEEIELRVLVVTPTTPAS